jgi:maltooligosyltrehalose synthase
MFRQTPGTQQAGWQLPVVGRFCTMPAMINDLWYKNAVIYSLSVGTYMDANGDGIGDFQGLMRRLDYLHGLGVTAVWLMPFQTSPLRDDGYDISDYYGVDPRYGTLGDFVEFTHAAQQRGIHVLIDSVVNHTSNEHRWFKEARKDQKSKYRDWYVWSKKNDFRDRVLDGRLDQERVPQLLEAKNLETQARLAEIGMGAVEQRQRFLAAPNDDKLRASVDRVAELYQKAYGWSPALSGPGERMTGRTMRQFIKSWITDWDIQRIYGKKYEIDTEKLEVDYTENKELEHAPAVVAADEESA